MSDTPTNPKPGGPKDAVTGSAAPPETATSKPEPASKRGVYVVYDATDTPITAFSAEIRALRRATDIKGSIKFRLYGDPFVV